MVSDEELIYLYRQGNDWALSELFERFKPIISRCIHNNKKELENLEYDEAECYSKCYLSFYQCIEYYCEHKEVSFGAYAYTSLQYVIKNYGRRISSPKYQSISLDRCYGDSAMFIVKDFHSDPLKNVAFDETIKLVEGMLENARGVEKAVLTCILAGYESKEIYRVLPYERKIVNNAIYRIRQKIKKMSSEL